MPSVGDEVLALGYANLDLSPEGNLKSDDDFLEAQLFASIGTVTEVIPRDPNSTRPWPLIRVRANWPGGMSGGPVFDKSGQVIGVVSMSEITRVGLKGLRSLMTKIRCRISVFWEWMSR